MEFVAYKIPTSKNTIEKKNGVLLLQWTWFFLNLVCDSASDIISGKNCVCERPF